MAARINFVNKVSNLYLEVYLLGYPGQGESILFLIKTIEDKDIILYSGVIDSYENNGSNKTIELLEHLNIKKLDFLCWTHPDIDHSLGIDSILQRYADKNTRVVLPDALLYLEERLTDTAKEICQNVNKIVFPRLDSQKYDFVIAAPGTILQIVNFSLSAPAKEFSFNITSVSPFPKLVYPQRNVKSLEHNIFSIALLMSFEGLNLFLGSDVEDRTIKLFRGEVFEIPEELHYIKIPHHASDGSTELFSFLNQSFMAKVACSTPFSRCKLPKRKVLREYTKYAEQVHCTSDFDNGNIGIVATQFDVINMGFKLKLYDEISKIVWI